ncbi:IS3 family transposase [Candidatus Riflebacteria bacterium]
MKKRRKFTKEFKEEAVGLSNEEGVSVTQVAEDLGICVNTLCNWRKKFSPEGKKLSAEQKEIKRLKKELRITRMERDILKKGSGYLLGETVKRYLFIYGNKNLFPIGLLCRVLKVSRSGFYSWTSRKESQREKENRHLASRIKNIHKESRENYGSPRIHEELLDTGYFCSKNRVARIMKKEGIRAKHRRKFRVFTTDSKHKFPVSPNILDRNFSVNDANQVWIADITYIPTKNGWVYLAAVMDLFSRAIVGWSVGKRITRQLTINALTMAVLQRKPPEGLLHHSDRGKQYACSDYQRLMKIFKMETSMSRKGNCLDNAVIESFFHTLKTELVHHRKYNTELDARRDIFEYIEVFYNRKRRHSSTDYKAPFVYEKEQLVA